MLAFLKSLFASRPKPVVMPTEPWAYGFVKRRAYGLMEWAAENKPEVLADLAACQDQLAVMHVLNKHSGLDIRPDDMVSATMPLFLPAMQRLHEQQPTGARQ
jgi:hypothetical protein